MVKIADMSTDWNHERTITAAAYHSRPKLTHSGSLMKNFAGFLQSEVSFSAPGYFVEGDAANLMLLTHFINADLDLQPMKATALKGNQTVSLLILDWFEPLC